MRSADGLSPREQLRRISERGVVRKLVGATKVDDAEPGTIRGDFATVTTENLVHASDGHESAAREIELWFPSLGS